MIIIVMVLATVSCNNDAGRAVRPVVIRFNTDSVKLAEEPRKSITFILGEDEDPSNPYYREAADFYQFNTEHKTDFVVTKCRSLLEVRNYLENNAPDNDLPWGQINLVSHGNQWLGLSVNVTPESKRATQERIKEHIENGSLKALPDDIADSKTEIVIHSCGVGNNPRLVDIISKAFGGEHNRPMAKASTLFEYYESKRDGDKLIESKRYFANAWHVNYKKGYKPEKKVLENMLRIKYPNEKINWTEAIEREQPRFSGDTYFYTFEIQVKWVINLSETDSIPDLSDQTAMLAWVKTQKEITESLKETDIPAGEFNWWIRKVYTDNPDGTKTPALWVKGFSEFLCVIKPVINDQNKENNDSECYFVSVER